MHHGALPQPEDDPDPTDRLPELVLEGAEQDGDPSEDTGTWLAPAGALADAERISLQERLEERDAAVEELTAILRQRGSALTRAENELEQARAELLRIRESATQDLGLAQTLQQVERARAALAAQVEEQAATIARLEDQVSDAREAEQRLEHELGEARDRLAQAEEGLGDARADLAVAQERATQLESLLAESSHAIQRCLVRVDVVDGPLYFLSGARATIGRTPDNDIQVHETYISRSHAVIKLGADTTIVEDSGSRNGVFVNERRVARELLHDGDLVLLGKARFRFRCTSGR